MSKVPLSTRVSPETNRKLTIMAAEATIATGEKVGVGEVIDGLVSGAKKGVSMVEDSDPLGLEGPEPEKKDGFGLEKAKKAMAEKKAKHEAEKAKAKEVATAVPGVATGSVALEEGGPTEEEIKKHMEGLAKREPKKFEAGDVVYTPKPKGTKRPSPYDQGESDVGVDQGEAPV